MYDNICKYLASSFPEDISSWLIGYPVKLTELKPTELSLEPIRADSLILQQNEELILHSEFQTNPDDEIPFRMLDYRVRGYRKYPQKQMRQIVVYLRKTNSELVYQNSFNILNTNHNFEVIRLWEQPTEIFLENPGLLPFAVLSKTKNPQTILTHVGGLIDKIEDRRLQSNLSASTAILAGLVLNQNFISNILRSDIMRESVVYQSIFHEGELKGELRGELRGELKGEKLKAQQIALNLLQENFSVQKVAQITNLTVSEIEDLKIIFDAQNNN